jgi:hypothetical protein
LVGYATPYVNQRQHKKRRMHEPIFQQSDALGTDPNNLLIRFKTADIDIIYAKILIYTLYGDFIYTTLTTNQYTMSSALLYGILHGMYILYRRGKTVGRLTLITPSAIRPCSATRACSRPPHSGQNAEPRRKDRRTCPRSACRKTDTPPEYFRKQIQVRTKTLVGIHIGNIRFTVVIVVGFVEHSRLLRTTVENKPRPAS